MSTGGAAIVIATQANVNTIRAEKIAKEAELALLEAEMSKEMEAIKGASAKEPQVIAGVIEQWVMAKETPKVEGA